MMQFSLAMNYHSFLTTGMAMLEGRGNKESMKNMMHNFWPSYKVLNAIYNISQ